MPSALPKADQNTPLIDKPERFSVLPQPRLGLSDRLQLRERMWERDPLQSRKDLREQMHWWAERKTAQAQQQIASQEAIVQIAPFSLSEGKYTSLRDPGSGIVIHPKRIILTNLHVVSDYKGPDPPAKIGDLLIVFLLKRRGEPPAPAFIAEFLGYPDLDRDEGKRPDLDLALLRITRAIKQPLQDCKALAEAIKKSGDRFKEECSEPLPDGFELQSYLQLGDSDAVQLGEEIQVWGYPTPS